MAKDDVRTRLKTIEALAARAGVPVRYEKLELPRARERSGAVARGGLVRLGKQRFVLCEAGLPAIDKIAVIAEALASIGVDVLDLPPVLRARIHGKPARPAPRPRLVLKPIVKARRTA
ncbi:MAG: hypothetical protein HYV09_37445 [Deltaproteobacteria bacterium]|nr:hypothetical protein [Deltaproteobacteria bacterium]